MKTLSFGAFLLVFALSATTANAVLVSHTFLAEITGVTIGGTADLAVGNSISISYSYDTDDFSPVATGVYSGSSLSVDMDFSANGGGEVFSAASFGDTDVQLVTNLAQDTLTIMNTDGTVSWSIVMQDPDGSALSSVALPTDLSGFDVVGTTFDFGGSSFGGLVEFAGGGGAFKAFTATIPEPSAFLFGGLVCCVVGFGSIAKRLRAKKA